MVGWFLSPAHRSSSPRPIPPIPIRGTHGVRRGVTALPLSYLLTYLQRHNDVMLIGSRQELRVFSYYLFQLCLPLEEPPFKFVSPPSPVCLVVVRYLAIKVHPLREIID